MATKITLGPVLYNWDAARWRDFHFRMADEAPLDSVCVGEVVCAKRGPHYVPHLAVVCERYADAGREVVCSTPALTMSKAERALARAAIEAAGEFLVEANDVGALRMLNGRPHAVGPFINVYNEDTLSVLARQGAARFCLNPELPGSGIAKLAGAAARLDLAPAIEVMIFGRAPLALSARCYHARAHGRHRDDCGFVCADDPDGMLVETLDGQAFVAVNGTQVLSGTYVDLLGELPFLRAAGVDRFRVMPQDCDMVEVVGTVRSVIEGTLSSSEGHARLRAAAGHDAFSNGFFHGRQGVTYAPSVAG